MSNINSELEKEIRKLESQILMNEVREMAYNNSLQTIFGEDWFNDVLFNFDEEQKEIKYKQKHQILLDKIKKKEVAIWEILN